MASDPKVLMPEGSQNAVSTCLRIPESDSLLSFEVKDKVIEDFPSERIMGSAETTDPVCTNQSVESDCNAVLKNKDTIMKDLESDPRMPDAKATDSILKMSNEDHFDKNYQNNPTELKMNMQSLRDMSKDQDMCKDQDTIMTDLQSDTTILDSEDKDSASQKYTVKVFDRNHDDKLEQEGIRIQQLKDAESGDLTLAKDTLEHFDKGRYDESIGHNCHENPGSKNNHGECAIKNHYGQSLDQNHCDESTDNTHDDAPRDKDVNEMNWNAHAEEKVCMEKKLVVDTIDEKDNIPLNYDSKESDSVMHVAKKQKTDGNSLVKKRNMIDVSIKQTSEILLALAGMAQLRGAKFPTELEKGLMSEARKQLGSLAAKISPKCLVSKDGIGSMIENLGLNKLKDQKKPPGPRKSILEREQEIMRKIEMEKKLAAAAAMTSNPVIRSERGSGNTSNNAIPSPMTHVSQPGLMKPPASTAVRPVPTVPILQPYTPAIPVMPHFTVLPYGPVDPRNAAGSIPSVTLSQALHNPIPVISQAVDVSLNKTQSSISVFPQTTEIQTTRFVPTTIMTTQFISEGNTSLPQNPGVVASGSSSQEMAVNVLADVAVRTAQEQFTEAAVRDLPHDESVQKPSKMSIVMQDSGQDSSCKELVAENLKMTVNPDHVKNSTIFTSASTNVGQVVVPAADAGRHFDSCNEASDKSESKHNHGQLNKDTVHSVKGTRREVKRPVITCDPHASDTIFQGAKQGETLGVRPSHADIARIVQKILQSGPQELRQVELPSRSYMNAPILCQICKLTVTDMDTILVCDSCDKGAHVKCLQAYNQKVIPKFDWHCAQCLIASNGRPLPPKYGRVGKSNVSRKVVTNRNNSQPSLARRTGTANGRTPQQGVSSSNGLKAINTSIHPELTISNMSSEVGSGTEDIKGRSAVPGNERNQECNPSDHNLSQQASAIQLVQQSEHLSKENLCSKTITVSEHSERSNDGAMLPTSSQCSEVTKSPLNMNLYNINQVQNLSNSQVVDRLQNEAQTNERLYIDCNLQKTLAHNVQGNTSSSMQHILDVQKMKAEGTISDAPSSSEGISESGCAGEDAYHVEWVGEKLHATEGKTYYQACSVKGIIYKLHDYALFRPETPNIPPYIARLLVLWEDDNTKLKWVQVNWCYHPDKIPQGVMLPTMPEKDEVYESNHGDANLVGSIQGPCQVLPLKKYQEHIERQRSIMKGVTYAIASGPVFLCRWYYDAHKGNFHPVG